MFPLRHVKQGIFLVFMHKALCMSTFSGEPNVFLRQDAKGVWELVKDGKLMRILGVGGTENLSLAKKVGANSVRIWDTEQLMHKTAGGKTLLAELEDLGLTLCAGIWVEHERHGFSYLDREKIREQREKVRTAVRKYRDHPNLLLWGLGNEMEIFPGQPEAVRVWKEVEELARIVKAEDPRHPVMTVIAGADERKIREIMEHYPSIDILGINAYRGAGGAGPKLASLGWKKPFLLAEFGPPGHWEVPKTAWGAPLEPTANEKAANYYATLTTLMENKEGLCLGSYAFLWGNKQETTSTWYGMLLSTGDKLPSVDAVAKAWSGKWPKNRSPKIASLGFVVPTEQAKAGTVHAVRAAASDPERDSLVYEWLVMAESRDIRHGGDAEKAPSSFPEAVQKTLGPECQVTFPPRGAYRLFLTVRDGQGGATTANLPFFSE